MSKTRTTKNKDFFASNFFGAQPLQELMHQDELVAIQKFSKGTANEYEQKLAFAVIVNKICRVSAPAFNESQAINSFNEGMRYVGGLLSMCHVANIDAFKERKIINNQN